MIALPTTRVAVMGPAGVEFVYKKELRAIRGSLQKRISDMRATLVEQGAEPDVAQAEAEEAVHAWGIAQEADLAARYERELMNPNEALSLGSISQIVMPEEVRKTLGENLKFHVRHYRPSPMSGPQREFH